MSHWSLRRHAPKSPTTSRQRKHALTRQAPRLDSARVLHERLDVACDMVELILKDGGMLPKPLQQDFAELRADLEALWTRVRGLP